MPPRVTFVTSNPNKLSEVRALLAPFDLTVRGLRRTLPEPQADRLETVVASKLDALPGGDGYYAVEDSGIFFEGLDGFPGVYSAYAYRTLGLSRLLRLLGRGDRTATFRTVAGLKHGRRRWICPGVVRGRIADRPRGSGGFGYDPIFIPEGEDRTFAEMPAEEKNRRSHRGRAFRRLARRLLTETG